MTSNNEKINKTIAKIEALLRQADHPNTGEAESDAFRNGADALMLRYKIEEIQLGLTSTDKAQEIQVEWESFFIGYAASEFISNYREIFGQVAWHFNLLYEWEAEHDEEGQRQYVAMVAGYPSDLRFLKMIWNSVRLEFSKQLEPRPDPTMSDGQNAYRLRYAGIEGKRMAQMMYGDDKKSNRIKARNAAKKYAAEIGEDSTAWSGQGNSMVIYRDSYALGFVTTISTRLYSQRRARMVEESGALVLASRKGNIDEVFYSRYENRRPVVESLDPAVKSTVDDYTACPKCKKAKSNYCREHAWLRPRYRTYKVNGAARDNGRAAARNVDLGITSREVK
jgi:hypothetical protein